MEEWKGRRRSVDSSVGSVNVCGAVWDGHKSQKGKKHQQQWKSRSQNPRSDTFTVYKYECQERSSVPPFGFNFFLSYLLSLFVCFCEDMRCVIACGWIWTHMEEGHIQIVRVTHSFMDQGYCISFSNGTFFSMYFFFLYQNI